MARKPKKVNVELADKSIDQNVSVQDPSPKIVTKEKNIRKKVVKPKEVPVVKVAEKINLKNHFELTKNLACSCVDWVKVVYIGLATTIAVLSVWAINSTIDYYFSSFN